MNLLIFEKVQADNMDIGVINCIYSQTISMDTHILDSPRCKVCIPIYRSHQSCHGPDHIRVEFTTTYVICAYHH